MIIQYLASLESTAPHFIDWTIKHQDRENVFLAWHCGNAPPSIAQKEHEIAIGCHSILGKSLGIDRSMGTGEFQVKPGTVTLCRLMEREEQFKMLISKGEIIPSRQRLRGAWGWVQVPDLNRLYDTLVMDGFSHHASLIHGDCGRVIEDACRLLGIESRLV
jgi:L-fucose isomerase-like protein